MTKTILKKLFWGLFRHFLSDRQYVRYRYWLEFDRLPELEHPRRFTEKIQYIKLNERTELRKQVADRIRVRSYVSGKIGEHHLIPLIGAYDKITKEDWNSFPPQFVLKANHGCNMVKIVKDKASDSLQQIQNITRRWLQTDYYSVGREWVYKDLPRQIITEELLLDEDGNIPRDFKFFCIHGKVELIQIDFNRFGKHQQQFFDSDFNLLDLETRFEKTDMKVQKPNNFEALISIAETLSYDFNFIRADLYSVMDQVYFGELTNYPGNGFSPFTPDQFDTELGKKLRLTNLH